MNFIQKAIQTFKDSFHKNKNTDKMNKILQEAKDEAAKIIAAAKYEADKILKTTFNDVKEAPQAVVGYFESSTSSITNDIKNQIENLEKIILRNTGYVKNSTKHISQLVIDHNNVLAALNSDIRIYNEEISKAQDLINKLTPLVTV